MIKNIKIRTAPSTRTCNKGSQPLRDDSNIIIRDGVQDYELLKIAESVNPERVMELSRSVAQGFTSFCTDENHLLCVRHELLSIAERARK